MFKIVGETPPRLHLALPGTGRDFLPVLRRVVAPQQIRRGRGPGFRPTVTDEAPRHVTRGILGAVSDLPLVAGAPPPPPPPRRRRPPRRPLLLVFRGPRGAPAPPPPSLTPLHPTALPTTPDSHT